MRGMTKKKKEYLLQKFKEIGINNYEDFLRYTYRKHAEMVSSEAVKKWLNAEKIKDKK